MTEHKDTLFWNNIEPKIKPVVKLLRDNGFNTTCSCEHTMTVEISLMHIEDVEQIAMMLIEAGYRNFKISAELTVPVDGFWYRKATLHLFLNSLFPPILIKAKV